MRWIVMLIWVLAMADVSVGLAGGNHVQKGEAMATTEPTVPVAGEKAPPFKLQGNDGKTYSLSDFAGKTLVLYFYPRADTPGCTKEACGFRDAISQYKKLDIAVLGVSPDSVEDIRKFSEKYSLSFPLLADADHVVAERYGVWVEKNNYGKKYQGVARTTFVIKDGLVVKVFEKVTPEGHEEEVLSWIRAGQEKAR